MNPVVRLDNLRLQDLHMHTLFSDGRAEPSQMLEAALRKGLKNIGISDHSYTAFDTGWCMDRARYSEYRKSIETLRKTCPEGVNLACGIEQDFYSEESAEGFDYIIGSVHYVRVDYDGTNNVPAGCIESDGYVYVPVDDSANVLAAAVDAFFGGDFYSFADAYYDTVSRVVDKTGADIVGHFDLLTKFNENQEFFDPRSPKYIKAWTAAADMLLSRGAVFEINTGAISRGYRSQPYPAADIIDYIRKRGGSFIISSDAHSPENVAYLFEEMKNIYSIT